MQTAVVCPYYAGNVINVTDREENQIRLKILKIYEPFSLACVMQVSPVDDPSLPERLILKMTDSRWLADNRKEEFLPPWDLDTQQQYVSSVLDGHLPEYWSRVQPDEDYWERDHTRKHRLSMNCYLRERLLARLSPEDIPVEGKIDDISDEQLKSLAHFNSTNDRDFLDPTYDEELGKLPQPTVAEQEIGFMTDMEESFRHEVAAYERLSDLQGRCIPKIFTLVNSEPWADAEPEIQKNWFCFPGILMEFVDGIPLLDLLKCSLQISWDTVKDNVFAALNVFPYYNVVHGDPYPRNVVIRQGEASKFNNIVIIDLGSTKFLEEIEGDDYFDQCDLAARVDDESQMETAIEQIRKKQGGIPCSEVDTRNYTSSRFWYPNNHFLLVPGGEEPRMLDAACWHIIMHDLWSIRDGRNPTDVVFEKFQQSRRAAQIMDAEIAADGLNLTIDINERHWTFRAVGRIAEEVLTTERILCDPCTSVAAYRVAIQDKDDAINHSIFKQIPKVGLITPPLSPQLQGSDQSTIRSAPMPSKHIVDFPEQQSTKDLQTGLPPVSPSSTRSLSSPIPPEDIHDSNSFDQSTEPSEHSDVEMVDDNAAEATLKSPKPGLHHGSDEKTQPSDKTTTDCDKGNADSSPKPTNNEASKHLSDQTNDDGQKGDVNSIPRRSGSRSPKIIKVLTGLRRLIPSPLTPPLSPKGPHHESPSPHTAHPPQPPQPSLTSEGEVPTHPSSSFPTADSSQPHFNWRSHLRSRSPRTIEMMQAALHWARDVTQRVGPGREKRYYLRKREGVAY